MFKNSQAFSGFSVRDLKKAQKFYGETLGLNTELSEMGLVLKITGSKGVFIYNKPNHKPATYTVLNFSVKNIDKAVEELKAKGIKFESYKGMTDKDGIARGLSQNMGPDIAWFKDPDENILSVLQEK